MPLPYLLPKRLQADPYGPSPLVTDLSITNPRLFAAASDRGPAPTLFASGDLPPFTASGIDPSLLAGLPYQRRHAAAAETNPALVLGWLEDAAMDRDAHAHADGLAHKGLSDYAVRMEAWVRDIVLPDLTLDDLAGQQAYPDSMKSPAMRRAEAEARAEVERQAEEARLREEIASESARWPRDYDRIDALAEQLTGIRAKRVTR